MTEWSRALGGVPIHLHEADSSGSCATATRIQLWRAHTKELLPGVTLVNAGGHYPGGTCLHWAGGAGGKGALLSGDIVQVVQDNKSVSFMWSFPNFIPLSAPRVQGVVDSLKPYTYDRVHGAFDRPHHLVRRQGRGGALGRALSRRSSAATAATSCVRRSHPRRIAAGGWSGARQNAIFWHRQRQFNDALKKHGARKC